MNRTPRLQALAAATTLALVAGGAAAAQRVDLHGQDLAKLKQQHATLTAQRGVAAMAHTRHEQLLQLESDSRLVLKTRNTIAGKARNTRYQQTFRGIPVFGEHVIVSEDANGNARTLFGSKITGLESEIGSTQAKLSKGQALAKAKQLALGNRAATMQTSNEKVTLTIFVDDGGRAHLAYHIDFFGSDKVGPTRPSILIDANTGKLLSKWENLQTELIGTGPGGNQKTGQHEYGVDFGFLDVTKNVNTCVMDSANVTTYNVNHRYWNPNTQSAPNDLVIHSYACPRNTVKAINGAYSPLNDAHYFGGVIFDMYRDYMNSAPLTFKLKMRVHFSNNYENAFWDGVGMTFGDGANTFYPLVSLDVSSHEVSHGYTEQQSGLIYRDQPGGLNEAFSDIAGEAADYYMKGAADFLVGADIMKGNGALRYMCNPTQDGRSIGHASNYTAGMDPHLSSGVYNKAFCELSKTAGWDVRKAFTSFAIANRDFWGPNTTYNQGAVGVLQAACDLGYNGQNVRDAFTLVGVNAGALPAGCAGAPANTPPVANFTSSVNGLTATFTDSSTDNDGNIVSRSWNFGDGTNSTATSPSKTYAAAGTYTVSLTVTDDDGATNTKTSSVTVAAAPGGGVLTNGVAKTGIAGAAGSKQYFTLAVPAGATGLKFVTAGGTGDADMYVKFNGTPSTTVYDCKSEGSTNAETCNIATAQAGTYTVLINGYTAISGVSLTGSYNTGGGAQTYSNTADFAISDGVTSESPITVSGRSGNAPSTASVTVAIVHTYIGDLKVDLVAPDGSLYNIHNRTGSSTDNINKTVTLNLSSEVLNGTWKLRVYDAGYGDVGKIDSWSITF